MTTWPDGWLVARLRPDRALVLALFHVLHALQHELLNAAAVVGLGREDVALGVDRNAVHGVELAGLLAAVAEAREHFEIRAIQDPDLLVVAVDQVQVLLRRILRERDVPRRAVTERARRDADFLDEGAIRFERLNAIVHTV